MSCELAALTRCEVVDASSIVRASTDDLGAVLQYRKRA